MTSEEGILLALEEHQQLLAFPYQVALLQERVTLSWQKDAQEQPLELTFHVFADGGIDDFEDAPEEALYRYVELRSEGQENVRLSYQLYTDRDNDVMLEENQLVGYGNYPS